MALLWLLLTLPVLVSCNPVSVGCEINSNRAECVKGGGNFSAGSSSITGPTGGDYVENKLLDDWLMNLLSSDRTKNDKKNEVMKENDLTAYALLTPLLHCINEQMNPRALLKIISRKGLVPILIGIGLKGLALIPLVLTALSIIGTIAIAVSKLSLAISAVMFLRRFFSNDHTSGGFAGLNPLTFPYTTQGPADQHFGSGKNRKTMYIIRGRSTSDDILENIVKYKSKGSIPVNADTPTISPSI